MVKGFFTGIIQWYSLKNLIFSLIFDGHAQNAQNGRQVELVQHYFVYIWYDHLHGLFD